EIAVVTRHEDRVLARDRDVVEEDPAVGRATDRRLAFRMERLPRPAATRPDDERRPRDSEILERFGGRIFPVVRRECLRRLGAALVPDEQRAATCAVVRSFGVLEAALLTVDMAHDGCCGAALEVRISVRCWTSTCSGTPLPPVHGGR